MKTVVVTGSSYGLGLAICHELLSKNYRVYGVSRSPTDIDNKNFTWIQADLLNPVDINKIPQLLSGVTVDILVNNAGMTVEQPALNFSSQDYENLFGLNFVAPIKMTVAIFGSHDPHGLVINISSNSDRYPDPLWAMYGSTKTALNLYFDTIALENPHLKVISLLPSFIDTPLLKNCYIEENFDISTSMKPSEVAEYADHIIEHDDDFLSGSRIVIVNNTLEAIPEDLENLMIYNVETKKLDRIKWHPSPRR